jgi:hypothetical protein
VSLRRLKPPHLWSNAKISILLLEVLVFGKELAGCFTLEGLHELGDRKTGRHGHEEMNVILDDTTFDNFHVFRLAYLSQKIPRSFRRRLNFRDKEAYA